MNHVNNETIFTESIGMTTKYDSNMVCFKHALKYHTNFTSCLDNKSGSPTGMIFQAFIIASQLEFRPVIEQFDNDCSTYSCITQVLAARRADKNIMTLIDCFIIISAA